jgi:hypothetical protein
MSSARRQRTAQKRGEASATSRRRGQGQAGKLQPSLRAFYLPLALTLALVLLSLLPRVQDNLRLAWSFWGTAAALLVWQSALSLRLRSVSASRSLQSAIRPQHYVQAMIQIALFAYWGWYWRPIYDFALLLVAQLVFAYIFDMLLAWSRRETYVLGFGPFPIIFSINIFLWFRDDWFYLQFLMIGVGFLGKEFVRWHREGRRVHIINPSAFTLGLFSLVLITTGTTNLTWGQELASTLTLAPLIYLYLFALGLILMHRFSITLVVSSAAVTLFGLSAFYSSVTGVPYFLDSDIPAAVFLGLHLLITDPSTSPRTSQGKILFGGLYGTSVFGLYLVLGVAGVPTFYDKLLAVPLLNLSVRGIDSLVRIAGQSSVLGQWRMGWVPLRANLGHMTVWVVFFAAMTVMGKTDGKHTGDSLPFWQAACAEDRPNACTRLIQIETTYCGDNSAWACNELGIHFAQGQIVASDPQLGLDYLGRACELRLKAACVNLLDPEGFSHTDPRVLDLRLLLREAGRNLMDMSEPELYARACGHDWVFACDLATSTP